MLLNSGKDTIGVLIAFLVTNDVTADPDSGHIATTSQYDVTAITWLDITAAKTYTQLNSKIEF